MALPRDLQQNFELVRSLGRGGMGEVLLCKEKSLDRHVAVKVMRGADDSEQRHRFLRESEALGALKHRSILQVYSSGVSAEGPFLVVEYLEGKSLAELPEGTDPLPALLQVAEGLEEVHRAGLVHRDVKPANIVVTEEGRAVLVDFGLVYDPRRTSITKERKFTGTMAFLAPEVLRGAEPTAASDWYAWGITLYTACEGDIPFGAEDLLVAIDGKPLPAVVFRKLDPAGPVADLIRAMTAEDPDLRPRSAADIQAVLAGAWTPPAHPEADAPTEMLAAVERGGPARGALAAGLLVTCLAIGMVATGGSHGVERPGSPLAVGVRPDPPPPTPPDAPPASPRPGSPAEPPAPEPTAPRAPRAIYDEIGIGDVAVFLGLKDLSRTVAFDPGGEAFYYAGAERYAFRVATADGEVGALLEGHEREPLGVALSPDGGRVATVGWEGEVFLWERATGTLLRRMPGHDGPINGVAFSPDGTRVVTAGSDQTARVFDVATGQVVRVLGGHPDAVASVAVAPGGDRIATGGVDDVIRIFRFADGVQVASFQGPVGTVYDVTFTPDGARLLSGHWNGEVWVRDAATGEVLARIPAHPKHAVSLDVARNGRTLATCGWDGTVGIFSMEYYQELARLKTEQRSWLLAVGLSPDASRVVAASRAHVLYQWSVSTGEPGWRMDLKKADLAVLTGAARRARARARAAGEIAGLAGWVRDLAVSPDGTRLAVATKPGTVEVRRLPGGELAHALRGHEGAAGAVAFSPDGRRLATAGRDGKVLLWDPREGTQEQGFPVRPDWVTRVAWVPSGGHVAAAGLDRSLELLEVRRGTPVGALAGTDAPLTALALAPDGKVVVAGGQDGSVYLWDSSKGREPRVLDGHRAAVLAAAIDPAGTRVATGDKDGSIRLWSLPEGGELAAALAHKDRVTDLAWSPDGARLYAASWDRTLGILDPADLSTLARPEVSESPLDALAVLPDGTVLAGGWEDRITRWTVEDLPDAR